jgi:hypothetical protein
MSSKIDGKVPNSVPPSVAAKIERGVPKRTAMSSGKKPTSSVKGV